MGGYVINFAVYTMAMLGLIFFALMVYKKTAGFSGGGKNGGKSLAIEETMSIAPRKTLYVVRAGEERFLIASDVDKTSLIAKLGNDNDKVSTQRFSAQQMPSQEVTDKQVFPDQAQEAKNFDGGKTSSVEELPVIVDFKDKQLNKQQSVIRNMLKKINE